MNIKSLSHAAKRWYDFNLAARQYHNWDHACRVVNSCYHLTNNNPPEDLVLAAWWHDAVYVAGAGSDANERCSAAALAKAGAMYADKASQDCIASAGRLIQYTKIETHLHHSQLTGILAILLDADLSSLADPYADFITTQKCIIAENGGTFEKDQDKSAAFLKQFLTCREFIYHTDAGRAYWEDQARSNIERYIKEVDNK